MIGYALLGTDTGASWKQAPAEIQRVPVVWVDKKRSSYDFFSCMFQPIISSSFLEICKNRPLCQKEKCMEKCVSRLIFLRIDSVIEEGGKVLPIEIKSGKDYYRHNAMDNVLKQSDYGIEEGYFF